jgi:hypothetical protein
MRGSEGSRPAANYKAYRALFLLLQSAAYQSISLSVAKGRPGRSRPGNTDKIAG